MRTFAGLVVPTTTATMFRGLPRPGFGLDGPRYAYPLRYGPRKTADCDGHGFYAGFDEYAEPAPSREAAVE
jgi:hypothetical protein